MEVFGLIGDIRWREIWKRGLKMGIINGGLKELRSDMIVSLDLVYGRRRRFKELKVLR